MAQWGPEAHMPQFQRRRLVSDLIIWNEWRQVLGVLAMVMTGLLRVLDLLCLLGE
jgi:hypothetical protein